MTQNNKKEEVKADWEKIAELFHDTYETLAPAYGYETRQETKVFDPQSKNGKLMIAVCKFVLSQTLERERAEIIKMIEEVEEEYDDDIYTPYTAVQEVKESLLSKLREKE